MRYAMIFDTKSELDQAAALLAADKGKATSAPADDQKARIIDGLEKALGISPLNRQKSTVLKAWLAMPEGEWLPHAKVVQAFVDAAISVPDKAGGQAAAALRDLSWQVSQVLPRSDLAQFEKPIEALASRSRSGGSFSYRLTPEGRVATERFLSKETSR